MGIGFLFYREDVFANGSIAAQKHGTLDNIDQFTAEGVRLISGDTLAADLIVLATGYRPQEELVEKLFGQVVSERVGPIWGFGDKLELRNMYCRTGQPGLYFIAGSFAQCRINSKYLALQIKAAAAIG